MLVSLSGFCQYPTVKTIGKDTVVIMTLKQGEEINKKFSSLSDTIKTLENKLQNSQINLNKVEVEKFKIDSSYTILNSQFRTSELEVKNLQKEIIQREKDFWKERRTWGVWMILSMAVTVFVSTGN
jgi:hypothetical protein